MRRFRSLPARIALACVGCIATPPLVSDAQEAPARLTAESLHSLLEQALDAFSRNDFPEAADLFQQLERDFGSESEYESPEFLRRMLPLKGHAELASGRHTAAATTLAQFADSYPTDPRHAAALYALGIALRQDGRAQTAAERFRQFERIYPRRPEAALALLQRAELLFTLEQAEAGLKLLDQFSTSEAPAILRHQARLRAGRQMLDRKDLPSAVNQLLDYRWNVQAMPEIAALSFSALELGDLLMEAEEFTDAIRAYRLVLPRSQLIDLQEKRIAEISLRLRRGAGSAGRFWTDYYGKLLESMRQQMKSLQESDDYTPSLLLRRGQAMLLGNRLHEAWLLFERLALDESLPFSMREEAHYRWTVAASGLELWEEALTIARNFLARYPDAPLAPQTLSLIAQAHQEQRRHEEASEILSELLARFPDHDLAQRWRFTHGFNRALLEDFAGARADFLRATADFPNGALTPNAELWHALTYFFERDYDTALAAFDALARSYPKHSLSGEILYRRASTLYAMREYDRAEEETADFVSKFQRHPRHGEALVLLGDIRMGSGNLENALAAFELIQPEDGHIFLYGLFQQGKILRARQDYDGMIALFSHYLQRPDLEEKPRLSEALYWIGWAHAQQERKEEAVKFVLTALESYGNDPVSSEIASVLVLLEDLHPLRISIHRDFSDWIHRDFSDWIEAERDEALAGGKLTYFSRLNLYLAEIKRRQGLPHQAENLLFEIANEVSIEHLGPEALGQVGHLLVEKELASAGEYFHALLKEYPHAPERAFAYHGFGKQEYQSGNLEEALVWFRRFENDTATHPLASEVLQMAGESLLYSGRHDEASAKLEDILRLRSMRGRPHALALMGLADVMVAASEPEKAIAYHQRVYTLHRAQHDLVAKAYFESSLLFEALEDVPAAHRTLAEMLTLTELSESEYFEKAREREAALAPRVTQLSAVEPEAGDDE